MDKLGSVWGKKEEAEKFFFLSSLGSVAKKWRLMIAKVMVVEVVVVKL